MDTSETRHRRKRDQRIVNPTPMKLTDRDKEIVRAVADYRVLRQDQIQALFFSHKAAAQRRLMKLYDYGYLARHFLPERGGLMSSPILYSLDKRGAALLRSEFGYNDLVWYPTTKALKDDFLQHTCDIATFRVAVTLACRALGYQILVWKGESDLKADYDRVAVKAAQKNAKKEVPVIPDSYFVISIPSMGGAPCFLELDRGTMTNARFRTKVDGYLAYYKAGMFEERYGTRSLRVLTVTIGKVRLVNLKRVTEKAGKTDWFWFSVLSELTPQTVLSAPVWYRAGQVEPTNLITVPSGSA